MIGSQQLKRRCRSVVAVVSLVVLATVTGCSRPADPSVSQPTATQVRSARRAFDGAPPVIPHKPLKADCVTCHTRDGAKVADLGFAPANPHHSTSQAGNMQNCRQCHLFQATQETFVASTFEGIPQQIRKGSVAYPGAPPMIPHSELMRENCAACHAGPSSRPEIRCKHIERANCRQCHLFARTDQTWTAFAD
ncbi:MAG: nitrate reductase cytochrome c-type subunit [Planctomycetaceae bacterium]